MQERVLQDQASIVYEDGTVLAFVDFQLTLGILWLFLSSLSYLEEFCLWRSTDWTFFWRHAFDGVPADVADIIVDFC